jgi:type VI secretion system protein ImpH
VQPVTMREGSALGRLGWDSYLVDGPQAHDRHDVHYELTMVA